MRVHGQYLTLSHLATIKIFRGHEEIDTSPVVIEESILKCAGSVGNYAMS